MKLLIDKVPI